MKITQLPSGSYTTLVYIGKDSKGKKHLKRFTAPTKARVKQMANEYLAIHTSVVNLQSLDGSIQRYLDDRADVLSPSTYKAYLSIQKCLRQSNDKLLRTAVDRITTSDIQKLVSSYTASGHSRKYISNILGLVRSAMKAEGYTLPTVTLPEKVVKDINFPSEDYVNNLLELAKGTKLELPLRLSTYGLRRGEVCALHKSDLIQKENNGKMTYMLHIQRSMVLTPEKEWVERVPKTPTSNRIIPIGEKLAKLILETDFVDGRVTAFTPRAYSAVYLTFTKLNNLEYYHLHSYRHFFASYLHSKGYTDEQIMKLGGWKTNHVMIQVYRHSMDLPDVSELMESLGD